MILDILNDKYALEIINKLESAGYSAYAVGGAVRDALLGREVNDVDIATSARPDQTREVFKGFTVIDTGIKHGTVTVVYNKRPYEITTYRVDEGYADSRHPDNVTFVDDIEKDLARRDFTVNAMAYSPKNGVVDPYGGEKDLNNKLIRAVGNARARFDEDALRILRALRFASVLGFKIEPETDKALRSLSYKLKDISVERIYIELSKLINGKFAENIILSNRETLEVIAPITGDVSKISILPNNTAMRFACLYGVGSESVLRSLHADNATINLALDLALSESLPNDIYALKRYIVRCGRRLSGDIAVYRRAVYGEDKDMLTESILESGCALAVSELDIKGSDISKMGYKGNDIGAELWRLLDEVIAGRTENKKSALLESAKNRRV